MKKLLLFKKFFIVLLLAGLSFAGWAQLITTDNFNYSDNTLLTNNGWVAHSGAGTAPIAVGTSNGLIYNGYSGLTGVTGVIEGNAARLVNTGEDDSKVFTTPVATGTVYFSFLTKITSGTLGYYLNLGSSATTFASRIFVKPSITAGKINFGISNTSTAVYAATPTDFDPLVTYLIIVKYEVSTTGAVSMWIKDSGIPLTEIASGIPEVATSGTGLASIDRICLRQYSATQSMEVDGIRVGLTWEDILPNINVTPTITITSPVTSNQWPQGTSHDISWTATGTNTDVMIEYSANASDVTPTWITLNASIPASTGVWSSWNIPANLALSADSKIRITDIPQTATGLSGIFSIIAAPAPVATFNPLAAATGVDIASNITVTFDVPVRNLDDSEITDANVASLLTLTTTDALGTSVPFTATIDAAKKVITINADADLLNEQLYYVAIAPVEGLSNNATVAQNITFTTAASLAPAISDVTILGTLPYHAGDLVTINWVSKNVNDVKIEAWVPSENAWTEMFATTPSDGSETFTIPVDAQYSTEYKIRVTDIANPAVTAESSIFTILAAISAVTITEVAPYYAGDQLKVNWTSTNILMVKVDLFDPATATWMNLASNVTALDGSTLITLPATTAYGAGYKVRVSDMASPASAESGIFTVIAVVNDLASLRAQPANAIVKYTGIATITYARTAFNQKYIQDATAAILIHDPTTAPGFISGTYNIGDGITNIVGKISLYNKLIELVPTQVTGEPATGIEIIPEVRTLASLTDADQSKLVKIENFAFLTPTQHDVDGKFVSAKSYDIDGVDKAVMAFRTAFAESDYIGGFVPAGPISSIVLVGQFNTLMQITPRSWSDMTVPTVAAFDATPTFALEGETVQFTDMSTNNPVSWEWTFVGGSPATSTEQNPLITYLTKGTYAVTLKATNASGGTNTITKTDYISIGVTGISTLESAVKVYPNPTSDKLYISNPANEKLEITILSSLGKPVKSMQASQGLTSVDLSDFPKGIYMIKMLNKTSRKTQMQKVLVK